MAFGQEMKDFVSGFKTGYDMFKSPQERAEHKQDRDWKEQDRKIRDDERDYQHKLDSTAQQNRDRLFNWQQQRAGTEDERYNDESADRKRRMNQADRAQNWREKFNLQKGMDPEATGDNPDSMKKWIEQNPDAAPSDTPAAVPDTTSPSSDATSPSSDATPAPATNQQSMAIPDYSGSGGSAPVQLASYNPSSAVGGDTTPMAKQSGRDTSYFDRTDMSGPEIAARMVQDLQHDYGMPQHVAQGITGALAAETGGFTAMQEEKPMIPGSKGGYGYAQWTGDRRKQFMNYAAGEPDAYGANYGFLTHELDATPEGNVLDKLKGARSAEEAQRIFTDNFLRPGVPNYKGRSEWTKKVGNVIGAPGGNAINAAVGGLVSALPDDQEQQPEQQPEPANVPTPTPRPDEQPEQQPEQQPAIPENVPTPTPRPDYQGTSDDEDNKPTSDPYEQGRRAVREGLKQALARSGADQQSAINDPELVKAQENYLKGYGAAPRQMMRQVLDTIDPDKKMSPGERNIKAMGMVYRYFNDKGEPDKAKEAAADMVQYYRQQSQQFLALAQAAAQNGDLDKAAMAAQAAYTNVPNGRDLKITKQGDGYLVEVTNADGKHVTKQVVSPQQFAAQAMHFNPSTFDDEILNAAGVAPDKYDEASLSDRATISTDVRSQVGESADAAGEKDPERTNIVGDIGQDIAGIKQNGMDANQAARFAHKLASMDNADIKPVRGNPNLVKVTADGQTVVMSKNSAAGLKGLRADYGKEAAADSADAKAKAERYDQIKTNIAKGIDAFRQGYQERTSAMQPDSPGANAGNAGASVGSMFTPAAIPDNVTAPTATPEQAAPGSGSSAIADDVGASDKRSSAIQTLLDQKGQLSRSNDPRARTMIQRIDDQLRSLGYTVQ